jgi:hypothetical protein
MFPPQLASYPMVNRDSFRGGAKRPGREAGHLFPSSAEVKKMRVAISPLSQHVFVTWCSVKQKAQGQIYLYLYLYIPSSVEFVDSNFDLFRRDLW